MAFDSVSKKKATACTPDRAKVELDVQVFEDPVTKKKVYTAPSDYDPNADDNVHSCNDVKPFVSVSKHSLGSKKYRITASVSQGTHPLSSLEISVDGQVVASQSISASDDYDVDVDLAAGSHSISVTVVDQALYDSSDTEGPFTVSFINNTPAFSLGRRS